MELTDIIKTHQYHLYEKYYSFLSELLNLKNMIHLYKERVGMNDDILNEIKELSSRIVCCQALTEKLSNCNDFISFIILLDKQKIEVEDIARHIKLTHEFVLQNITEKFSYLNTFPPLQKRYSSKALTEVLNSHHSALYKAIASFSDKESDKKLIYSVWSHSDNYRLKSFSNKSYFTQHSFYYHDIVWNIPTIIDHEVILAALQNNDECKTWVEEVSKNIVEKYSTSMKENKKYSGNEKLSFALRTYYKEFDDFLRGNIEPILWELLADFVGYGFYGEAYIKSFLHETLGEFFGREFFDLNGNRHDHISISVNIKRDSLLLRQLLLLERYAVDTRDIDSYKDYMFSNVSAIIGHGGTSTLVKLMVDASKRDEPHVDTDKGEKELKHHIESAKLYSAHMRSIYATCRIFINNVPDIEINIDTPFVKPNEDSIASELWNERDKCLRSGKLPHRSILRQKLLGAEYEPCILYRSHIINSSATGSSEELAFGQFDSMYIQTIEDKQIDILEKINNLIHGFSLKSDNFSIKHALLRVAKSDEDDTSSQPIRLYMMLYLKNGNMKNSMDLLNKIEVKIKSFYASDPKYALYKSYGPEDIVIEIDFDDEEIWKFIELIRSEFKDDIKETFSSIVMLDYTEVTLNNNIWIKGYYRLLPDVKFQDLYKQAENIERYKKLLKTNSMRILDITNKYYDFEIWWNTKDIEQIIAYEKVLGNELLDSTYFIVSSNNSLKYGKATKTKSRKGIS